MRQVVFYAVTFLSIVAPHPVLAQEPLGLRLGDGTRVASTKSESPVRSRQDRTLQDRIFIENEAELFSDGRIVGRSVTQAFGPSGRLLNRFVSHLVELPLGMASDRLMARQMLLGEITALMPRLDEEQASVSLDFSLKPVMTREGVLTISLMPGPRLVRPAFVTLVSSLREKMRGPAACPYQSMQQRSKIGLPKGYAAVALPPDISIQLGATSYSARYRRVDDTLEIERIFLLDAGLSECSAEKLKEIAPVIHAAAHDSNRRIVLP